MRKDSKLTPDGLCFQLEMFYGVEDDRRYGFIGRPPGPTLPDPADDTLPAHGTGRDDVFANTGV